MHGRGGAESRQQQQQTPKAPKGPNPTNGQPQEENPMAAGPMAADSRVVVVVTGANRGIGKAVVRQLVQQDGRPVVVYLTARDVECGQLAVDDVRRAAYTSGVAGGGRRNEVRFHQLEVGNGSSEAAFLAYLTLVHGRRSVDVLLNNAGGVARSGAEVVRRCDGNAAAACVAMNYATAVRMTERTLPHMRDGGRVLFMASALGHLGIFSGDLPRVLTSPDLTVRGLDIIENGFVSAVRRGNYASYGFPPMPFAVAKAGLVAYARVLARTHADDPRHMFFAAICPGYVRTAMTGPQAPLSPDQGAETPVYLALTPDHHRLLRHNGELWKRLKPLKW
ncbi:hypothetical protein GGF46_002510 [Coemansia sp. RSA 552]|nr:hypothetical protein GGF46_002510 [Coemansia sp. RSA 552]